MQSALKKIGNSSGVIIPKPFLEQIGVQTGDRLEMTVEGDRVVIEKAKRNPHEGWAEASALIGADGLSEEDREWLDAPLSAEADAEWEWDGEW